MWIDCIAVGVVCLSRR